jgi:hypothetical protein
LPLPLQETCSKLVVLGFEPSIQRIILAIRETAWLDYEKFKMLLLLESPPFFSWSMVMEVFYARNNRHLTVLGTHYCAVWVIQCRIGTNTVAISLLPMRSKAHHQQKIQNENDVKIVLKCCSSISPTPSLRYLDY